VHTSQINAAFAFPLAPWASLYLVKIPLDKKPCH